jgi:hypothetical protein
LHKVDKFCGTLSNSHSEVSGLHSKHCCSQRAFHDFHLPFKAWSIVKLNSVFQYFQQLSCTIHIYYDVHVLVLWTIFIVSLTNILHLVLLCFRIILYLTHYNLHALIMQFHPEDGVDTFLWNVGNHLQDTWCIPRRPKLAIPLLFEYLNANLYKFVVQKSTIFLIALLTTLFFIYIYLMYNNPLHLVIIYVKHGVQLPES